MNLNNYTIKAQEAIENAFLIAQNNSNQAIDTGHLLKSIFEVEKNISQFILKKHSINETNFATILDRIIQSYPKVTGASPYLSNEANSVLNNAQVIANPDYSLIILTIKLHLNIGKIKTPNFGCS
jgi:ATP-dependent Clp protease ATP-binding subunit ClpB